jgi:hypothetical protein
MSLSKQVKTALDEAWLLMLGARIAVLCCRGDHPPDDARRASPDFLCGRGYTLLLHDRVLVRHPCACSIGAWHCRGSLFRTSTAAASVTLGAILAFAVLCLLTWLWYIVPMVLRARAGG